MKFTFQWLKEHLETGSSLDEIVERLTMIGLEIEKVSFFPKRKKINNIAIGIMIPIRLITIQIIALEGLDFFSGIIDGSKVLKKYSSLLFASIIFFV